MVLLASPDGDEDTEAVHNRMQMMLTVSVLACKWMLSFFLLERSLFENCGAKID